MKGKGNQPVKEAGLQKTIIYVTNVKKMFEKIYWLIIFFPVKKWKKAATSNRNIIDQVEPSRSSQASFDMVPQKYVVCAIPQTYEKWHKVDGIVFRWVDVVKSEIGQTMLETDVCKFFHFAGRNKCFSKLKKEVRSRTKCVVCDFKLTTENNILVVTPNARPFLEY